MTRASRDYKRMSREAAEASPEYQAAVDEIEAGRSVPDETPMALVAYIAGGWLGHRLGYVCHREGIMTAGEVRRVGLSGLRNFAAKSQMAVAPLMRGR